MKEYVYFLSVERAQYLAEQHKSDENWDLWSSEAVTKDFSQNDTERRSA